MLGLFEVSFLRELTVSYAAAVQIYLFNSVIATARIEYAGSSAELAMRDFVARPLFLPSRRPVVKPVAPAVTSEAIPKPAPPPAPEPTFVLLGVVVTPKGREAILWIDGDSTRSIAEGESFGEWSIKRVFSDHVILSSPRGERRLAFMPHGGGTDDPRVVASPSQQFVVRRRRP